jgi:hypothetical protein
MKIVITEEQYQKILLNELGNRGKNLASYIRHHYEVMGQSFTPRGEGGAEWKSADDIAKEIEYKFPTLPKGSGKEIVDYYLNII